MLNNKTKRRGVSIVNSPLTHEVMPCCVPPYIEDIFVFLSLLIDVSSYLLGFTFGFFKGRLLVFKFMANINIFF